jgi:hypothetical protein
VSSGQWVQRLLANECVDAFPWIRRQAPLMPVEAARWAAAVAGGWGMEWLDRL